MKTLVLNNLDELYFTSDTHFHHANIIEYCDRPFKSLEEMDKTMISNWNSKVPHGAWIFILGDFCWGDRKMWCYYLSQLPGNKILIQGNHDRDKNIPNDKFIDVVSGFLNIDVKDPEIKGGSQRMTLCHYPMLSWYQSHKGAWQLFGHMHNSTIGALTKEQQALMIEKSGKAEVAEFLMSEYKYLDKIRPNQYDVGVDGNDFTPLSYKEIRKIITARNLHNSK